MKQVASHSGFTLVEVIIAVMILTVGLLGLASTAGVVTRMIGQGQRYSEVAWMASQRFETLRSQTCASMSSGSASEGQFSSDWTVTPLGTTANRITVNVTSPTGVGTRIDTFETSVACD